MTIVKIAITAALLGALSITPALAGDKAHHKVKPVATTTACATTAWQSGNAPSRTASATTTPAPATSTTCTTVAARTTTGTNAAVITDNSTAIGAPSGTTGTQTLNSSDTDSYVGMGHLNASTSASAPK